MIGLLTFVLLLFLGALRLVIYLLSPNQKVASREPLPVLVQFEFCQELMHHFVFKSSLQFILSLLLVYLRSFKILQTLN
jgi:hypothetical protein